MNENTYRMQDHPLCVCPYIPLYREKSRLFFFDENGIWCSCDRTEAGEQGLKDDRGHSWKPYPGEPGTFPWMLFGDCREEGNSRRLMYRILGQLSEGDSVSKVHGLMETTEYRMERRTQEERDRERAEWPELDRAIAGIEQPRTYRARGNRNRTTFDFVEVFVKLSVREPDPLSVLQRHAWETERRVREKIAANKVYRKYGVPVGKLVLTSVVMPNPGIVRYLFENRG